VISTLISKQSFVPDGDSSIGKFLSTTCEIGLSLFSNLEKRFSMEMDDHKSFNVNDSLVQENWKVLSERHNYIPGISRKTSCSE